MYDYGARFYDPSISLWTSVDPLTAKMPQWSGYAYTFNNPVVYKDPDGEFPIPVILGLIGAGFEYGSQVYSNYQNGQGGYDAWVGSVDFADVVIEGVATGTGAKFTGTVVSEGLKASIDVKGSGDISYIGDGTEEKKVSNVLKTTATNLSLIHI